MRYKKGQKVRILKKTINHSGDHMFNPVGKIGYIYSVDSQHYTVNQFENWAKGSYYGLFEEGEVEPVNAFEPPFYVDCPTQEIWDKVEKKMFEIGYKWNSETSHVPFKESYGVNSYIRVENDNKLVFGSIKWGPIHYKHIPYQQFLGEEVKRAFRVGDVVEVTNTDGGDFHGGREYIGVTFTITETGKYKDKTVYILSPYTGYLWYDSELKLITPVEEKEEKHKNLVAEYPLPPMYPSHNDMYLGFGPGVNLPMPKPVNPFYKLSKSLMSGFKKATAFIKRLGEPLSTYYSLGWVELENDEFTTTPEGKQALADFTLIGGAKTFEEYAKKELARRKKASKVKDEEED